jgi:lipopolysaccharide export system protein LptC
MGDVTGLHGEPATRTLDLLVGERSGAVRKARLHSARVKFLRFAIVGSCSIAAVLFVVIVFFDPFHKLPGNISIGSVGVEGTRVTVDAPRITGYRKDGRPYDVLARIGYKDILKPDITELVDVDATVGMGDNSSSRIKAKTGVHDAAKDSVFLKGAIKITNPTGYDMRLSTATMDFGGGSLVTDDPVDVFLHATEVTSDRMAITDNGHKISFFGHVKSVIQDEDETQPAPSDERKEAAK